MKRFSKPKNQAQFWLYVTVVFAVLWGLGGLLGALTEEGTGANSAASILSGTASCCLLGSAILSLGERRGRETPGKTQRIVEVQLSLLMLVMIVFGEFAALRSHDVSLSPMATMGMLSLIFCVWIAAPKIADRRKFETGDILKVIVLGCAAAWLLAKYISLTAAAFA